MRKALTLLVLLLAVLPLSAETVSREEALLAGQNFLAERSARAGGWGDRGAARALDCLPLQERGRVLAWWMPVEPRGHVILSPIREMPAVKAWSETEDFRPGAAGYPTLIEEVMRGSLDMLEEAWGGLENLPAMAAPASNRDSWERLLSGAPAPRDDVTVGPLLTSSWHQGAPYNDDCPEGDGGTCVVGCVATAAAQIMSYWDYPATGQGSHSYTWDGDQSCGGNTGGGTLTASFGDGYAWDLILDSYGGGYTPEQAAAAAEINSEVGIAYDMDYGACGSGAYVHAAVQVFPSYFRYEDCIEDLNRSGYSAQGWFDRIREEFDAFPPRPISYGIYSHAIVCDGYQISGEDLYYHFNYGWGGGNNSWYALDNLYCPWDGCNYLSESMMARIEPMGYFMVTAPAMGELWEHGDPMPALAWVVDGGASVVADLYRGDDRVARIQDWTPNDGGETPSGTVSADWGTGDNYRVKIVDDLGHFGWSDEFSIYAPGEWTLVAADPLGDAGNGQGACWGDFDGDGNSDLFLSNQLDGCRLFLGDGSGGFSDATAPPLDAGGYCREPAAADYDNDGDLDIYLTRMVGNANLLLRNEGDGSFSEVASPEMAGSDYSLGAAWGDYDGDGWLDLYVANVYAADRLFRNLGDGSFADATAPPLGDAGYGKDAVWTDLDADGDLDLYLIRYGSNILYENQGDGSFLEMDTGPLADSGDGFGAAFGDWDNDGDLDLYLVNEGTNRLLSQQGGAFTDVTPPLLGDEGSGRGATWLDYDNDGRLDLFLANEGGNRFWRNEPEGFSERTDALLGDASQTQGAAWSDHDRDGRLDLYLVNEDGPNRLLRNDAVTGNSWVQVRLVGTRSARMPLGARMRLEAGGQILTRTLGDGTAYLSGSDPWIPFGLGGASQVDSLEVFWPSGEVSVLGGLAVNQFIEIVEPETGTAAGETPDRVTGLTGAWPNPFNPAVGIHFSLAEAGPLSLDIFDLSGRRVRRLSQRTWPAGEHSLTWSGINDAGEPLASGVYFLRFQAAGKEDRTKLLLVK